MRLLSLLSLLLSLSFVYAQEDKKNEEVIDAPVGIDVIRKLDFDFNPKVLIGDSSKLQLIVIPSKKELTFRGLKAGQTSVIIRDTFGEIRKRYKVTVTATGKSTIVAELRELIGEVEGIEIGIKGGKVFVGGEIIVPDDIGRLSAVLSSPDYKEVLRLIELSPHTQSIISKKIQEEFVKNNMREVSIRVVNKTFWLEGVVNSGNKKTLAVEIAKAYIPDQMASLSSGSNRFESAKRPFLLDFISVNEKQEQPPPPKMVKISSQFVELAKDFIRDFGFKWAPFFSEQSSISFNKTQDGEVTTSEQGTLSGTISNLFPKLSSAKNAGYARVIQSGMVIVENQKTGTLSKVTKQHFAVGAGETSRARSEDIKFDLNVTPNVLNEEKVNLDISLGVANPNTSDNNGNPSVTTNNIKTFVTVNSKESAVIGGVVQNSSGTEYDKTDPDRVEAGAGAGAGAGGGGAQGQAREAPLFALLRSKRYTSKKTQFVIFVTPEIIESASEGTEEIRRKFRKRVR